ncbi:MAG: VOC family protein [Betaproteobacteria bacterium]
MSAAVRLCPVTPADRHPHYNHQGHRLSARPNLTAPHEAIPVLRVADGPASAAWYRRLGFQEDWRHQHEPGLPWFISISTPQGATLFLSEHAGDCAPGGAVFLVTHDIAAAEAALNMRAERMPWGDRELSLLDPDGNRVRVSQPAESAP